MLEQIDKIMKQGVAERVICLIDISDDRNRECYLELYKEIFDVSLVVAKKYLEML